MLHFNYPLGRRADVFSAAVLPEWCQWCWEVRERGEGECRRLEKLLFIWSRAEGPK